MGQGSDDDADRSKQGWRYSMLFGLMYGNVPVGIIVAGIAFVIWMIVR